MPAKPLMTWVPARKRWTKKYRGKMYAVSCRALGTDPTKEASTKAANDWWRKKQTELESESLQESMLPHLGPRFPDSAYVMPDPETGIVGMHYKMKQAQRNSIRGHIEAYKAFRRAKVKAGEIQQSTMNTEGYRLKVLADWEGADKPVSAIDGPWLKSYYMHLTDLGLAGDTAKGTYNTAKTFVQYLWENEILKDLPRTFHSNHLTFTSKSKKQPSFSPKEVKALRGKVEDRMELHLLLMLNCGMTQKDISDLQQDEVNWARGRIKRKRSKEKDEENVPEVEYQLWPRTFELLKKYRSEDPTRALLNSNGNPFVVVGNNRTDTIALAWGKLPAKLRAGKSLKVFRKTGATLLEDHETYGRYARHYLGHSPRSVADKHYITPSQKNFDQAIEWLGQELGIR